MKVPSPPTVRRMFSDIAPTYDRLNHLLSLSVDRAWRRTVARALLPNACAAPRILDICAGTGDLALDLARRCGPAAYIVALDFSEEMLRLAREKFRRARHRGPQPRVLLGDALHLPVAPGTFDFATMAFGLRNLADPVAGLRELARILRPDGQAAILEFSMPRSRWIAPLYRFYLGRVLPTVGRVLTRSSAYTYLADTVAAFPSPEVVLGWMAESGLRDAVARPLTGGIATLYTARQRSQPRP